MQNKQKISIGGGILCAAMLLPQATLAADNSAANGAAASLLKPKTESIAYAEQQAKHQKVTGLVLDENGEAVIGASVVLKSDPKKGTVTDADGKFTLDVTNTKDILLVSYLGFQTQEVAIKGKTLLSITLKEDAKQLGDVVVTAFGATQKKETVVGSIQQVKPESLRVRRGRTSRQRLPAVYRVSLPHRAAVCRVPTAPTSTYAVSPPSVAPRRRSS